MKVLISASECKGVEEPIRCSTAENRRPMWKIVGLDKGMFIVRCSNGDTFRANKVYVEV